MTLEQLIEVCTSLVGLDPGHRRVIEEAIARYRRLAEVTGLSESQVRNAASTLKGVGKIERGRRAKVRGVDESYTCVRVRA